MYARRFTQEPARIVQLLVSLAAATLIVLFAGSTLLAQSEQEFEVSNPEELAEAIEQANSEPAVMATIILHAFEDPLESPLPEIQSTITVDGSGRTVQRDDGPEVSEFRIFDVDETGDLTLTDVTISGGRVASEGGGIRNRGSLTISGSTILNNTVFNPAEATLTRGGGVFNADGAELTVLDSTIEGNQAIGGFGGGISAQGNVAIAGSTLNGNVADQSGGAIAGNQQFATLHIESSEIYDNHALHGGGVSVPTDSETVILDSEISGNTAEVRGGGINVSTGGELSVIDSEIRDNSAGGDGGGIFGAGLILTAASEIDLDGVKILNNTSGGHGGGVRAEGWLWVSDSHIEGNTAEDTGGGLSIHPHPGVLEATIESSEIVANTSANGSGGGISFQDGEFSLARSTVSQNDADGAGGGVRIGPNSEAHVVESTIDSNESGRSGGGIAVSSTFDDETHVVITNATISGNISTGGSGGGLSLGETVEADLNNLTIIGNTNEEFGGGGVSLASGAPLGWATLTIGNTIVAQNTALNNISNDIRATGGASLIDNGHNLVGDGATTEDDLVDGENGNIVGTAGNPVDPALGPLQDNGGPTETTALLDGSPALEAGNDEVAPTIDQRGIERPQSSQSDIGAYEREVVDPEPEPAEMIDELRQTIDQMDVHRSNQLTNQLDSALRHLARDRERQACHHLDVFIQHVERQAGQRNGLTSEEAVALLDEVELIRAAIGC